MSSSGNSGMSSRDRPLPALFILLGSKGSTDLNAEFPGPCEIIQEDHLEMMVNSPSHMTDQDSIT